MKPQILAATILASASVTSSAVTIVAWDFETNTPPDVSNSAANGPHNPSIGTGSASGLHASALTDWTTPSGNGSPNAYSSNEWAIGDYYQFTLSTVGFSGIYVSFSQTRSSTGPSGFDLEYSTDGGTSFNVAQSYIVDAITFSAATPNPAPFESFDLTSITALNNDPDVVFRLRATSAPSAAAGTNRVDDFIVSDAPIDPPIPEPGTALTLVSGLGMLGLLRRRTTRA